MFGNTHVKAGVRLAGVALGVAAVGLLGAPVASAAATPPAQEASNGYVADSMHGTVAGVIDCLSELLHKAVKVADNVGSQNGMILDKGVNGLAGE